MKRVLILGIDGYIGYALAMDLLEKNYEVCGLDNVSRRRLVEQAGSDSLIPIPPISSRIRYLRGFPNFIDSVACVSLSDFYLTKRVLREYKPDVIVHLAEQPSAPWSMRSADDAITTQTSNVAGTLALLWAMREECPKAHLVKLGTMGEYGTPECDIPEGMIPKECIGGHEEFNAHHGELENVWPAECPMSGLPFPRSPGSFYHLSKVHDTHNIIFACKTWGLHSTDIMQGIVFGLHNYVYNELSATRFDYDEYFGTVINRFCAQAVIGHNLTVYGKGTQTRGLLTLKDSLQCLNIVIENPPKPGEYRVFNQYGVVNSMGVLALFVIGAAEKLGIKINATNIRNPRTEDAKHYYNPTNEGLRKLGYKRSWNTSLEISKMLVYLKEFKSRVNEDVIMPKTKWR